MRGDTHRGEKVHAWVLVAGVYSFGDTYKVLCAFLYEGQVVVPLVFVFCGEVTFKALLFEFIQYTGDIADTCSPGNIVGSFRAEYRQVFDVEGNETALQFFDAGNGIEPGTYPVADVAANTDHIAAPL